MLLQPSGTDIFVSITTLVQVLILFFWFRLMEYEYYYNLQEQAACITYRYSKKKETNKSQSLIFSLPLLVPENCFLFTIYTIPAFICSLREFQNKFGNRNLNGTLKILSTSSTSCYISVSTGL